MSLRVSSLSKLGKGAWRVASITPSSAPSQKKASTRKDNSKPHEDLWALCSLIDGAQKEFEGAVPGRKYRIDIAFPEHKLAIEIDGWEWHGKHKGDFQRDRERQNLLMINGWRILRFTAKDIRNNPANCLAMIQESIRQSA